MKEKTIYFIGGIHGVGKGTLCKDLEKEYHVGHVTASELLKWKEISTIANKNVKNIQTTQDRLLLGLESLPANNYLLDGHFCLFNNEGEPERIPFETFQKINPKVIALVTEDVGIISSRLESRDLKRYDIKKLEMMQKMEIEYAIEVSQLLRIPFVEINQSDLVNLTKLLPKR
jgi:adenylate kinase